MAQLAQRAGAVAVDEDGDPDLDGLAERVNAADADRAAWQDYERVSFRVADLAGFDEDGQSYVVTPGRHAGSRGYPCRR